MSEVFFADLDIRRPDHFLGAGSGSHAVQTCRVMTAFEPLAFELAADVVVVGSWVEGFVVAGVRPAKAMRTWLAGLPRLGGRPVGVFCTFAVAPKGAVPAMRRAVETKGAVVVAQAAFGPGELGEKAGAFGPAAFGRELALRTSIGAKPRVLVE